MGSPPGEVENPHDFYRKAGHTARELADRVN